MLLEFHVTIAIMISQGSKYLIKTYRSNRIFRTHIADNQIDLFYQLSYIVACAVMNVAASRIVFLLDLSRFRPTPARMLYIILCSLPAVIVIFNRSLDTYRAAYVHRNLPAEVAAFITLIVQVAAYALYLFIWISTRYVSLQRLLIFGLSSSLVIIVVFNFRLWQVSFVSFLLFWFSCC
jgi:hypothetical protein